MPEIKPVPRFEKLKVSCIFCCMIPWKLYGLYFCDNIIYVITIYLILNINFCCNIRVYYDCVGEHLTMPYNLSEYINISASGMTRQYSDHDKTNLCTPFWSWISFPQGDWVRNVYGVGGVTLRQFSFCHIWYGTTLICTVTALSNNKVSTKSKFSIYELNTLWIGNTQNCDLNVTVTQIYAFVSCVVLHLLGLLWLTYQLKFISSL